MLDVKCVDYFKEVKKYAESIGMLEQLEGKLKQLDCREDERVSLYQDFAPYSFLFEAQRPTENGWKTCLSGGLIYHGPGGNPMSITVTPVKGWAIHT